MAILTTAGRADRGQLLPRLPRRPDLAAHPEGQGDPDPPPRRLGGAPHAEGGQGAPWPHHARALAAPRRHHAGPRGRLHSRKPQGGGTRARGCGGGGGQDVAPLFGSGHDGVAARPACQEWPALTRGASATATATVTASHHHGPSKLRSHLTAELTWKVLVRCRAYFYPLELTFTTQGHRTGRRHDSNHDRRGLLCSGLGSDQRCQGFRPALALLSSLETAWQPSPCRTHVMPLIGVRVVSLYR